MKPYQHRELEFLRSFIREALVLEDDYGMDPYSGGGGGGGGGDGGMFKLVEPFLDLGKTITGQSKELLVKLKSSALVAFEAIVSSFIPFLSADYKKIFEKEKSQLQSIRSQYQSVYDRTNKAFKNSDIGIAAVLSFPDVFFTSKFLKEMPEVAGEMSSILLGDKVNKSSLEDLFFSRVGKVNLNQLKSRFSEGKKRRDKKQQKRELEEIIELRAKVMREALQQPEAKEMQKNCLEVLKQAPLEVLEKTKQYANINSIQDIEKMLNEIEAGDKLSEIKHKLKQLKDDSRKNNASEANNVKAVISGSKEALKNMSLGKITKNLDEIRSAGVSDDSEIVKFYNGIIAEIKKI